jgi:hypothetical protein
MSWKRRLEKFKVKMVNKIELKIPEKGLTWQNSKNEFLIECLIQHLRAENWVDVANLAFMLWDNNGDKNANI